MYPNMCPMNMYQMPMYYYPIMAGQMMQPMMPYYDMHEKENYEFSGYRCMRDEDEAEDNRNINQGTQTPQTDQTGLGHSGHIQSGVPKTTGQMPGMTGTPGQMPGMTGTPGMPGQAPGSTMQGTPGMPMQQMMNSQHVLQMIERHNPEIIRMMTDLRIPLTTARQIILSILQAAQTHIQMMGR